MAHLMHQQLPCGLGSTLKRRVVVARPTQRQGKATCIQSCRDHHQGCDAHNPHICSDQIHSRSCSSCHNEPAAQQWQSRLHVLGILASSLMYQGSAHAEEIINNAAATAVEQGKYVPTPYEPGWEIWVGTIAGIIPFAIGSYEFGKRILIQLRCELCAGKGLVPSTNPGNAVTGAKYLRKCPKCGGFFPWVSWKLFLTSTAAPGNGGPLQQPKGQTSVFYKVPEKPTQEQIQEARAKYMAQGKGTTSPEQDMKESSDKKETAGNDSNTDQSQTEYAKSNKDSQGRT